MFIKTISKETVSDENEIKGKVIRNARLARQILNVGGKDVWLFDVKPDRLNKERTCFVFEDTDKFQEVFSKVLEENRKNRESREASENAELRNELEDLKRKFAELSKMTENVNADA